MHQPQVSVSSIIMNEGKVLIGRTDGGKWETPTTAIKAFEGIKEAAVRAVLNSTGVASEPQNVIFVSEVLKEEESVHKILIYLSSKYVAGGDSFVFEGDWIEAVWVDVRKLYQYQECMSDETVDAFYKFSQILRQMAVHRTN